MRVLALSGGKDSIACLHLCRHSIDCAIYVDTGKAYPETQKMIRYAQGITPVVIVQTNQQEQNDREGIPSDVVPIDWTQIGQQVSGTKPAIIQSYLSCCFENISYPLLEQAKELGATEIIFGQRNEDGHKATTRDGEMTGGIRRLHPIEDWTSEQVLKYLKTVMEVPEHFYLEHSSLDCYDCTAYRKETQDRVAFTQDKYPEFHQQHQARMELIKQSLAESGYMENESWL